MRYFAIAATAVCVGCSSLPSADDISKFSSATSTAAATVTTAMDSAELIAVREDEENQALNFVKHQGFTTHPVPATAVRQIPVDKLQLRVKALDALQVYAKAIGEAADKGAIDKLEASSQELGAATAAFATAFGPGAAVVTPIAKLGGRALGYAASDRYVREVLGVIRKTDPTVTELISLLKLDLDPLPRGVLEQAKSYAAARDEELAYLNEDKRLTRLERYQAYQAARLDVQAQFALANAASSTDKLLDAIASSHSALAKGSHDSTVTINRFAALTEDFASVITAAKTEAK